MKTKAKIAASAMLILFLTMLVAIGYLNARHGLELTAWQVIAPVLAMLLASGLGVTVKHSVGMTATLLGFSLGILINSMFSENLVAMGATLAGIVIGLFIGGYLVSLIVESKSEWSRPSLRLVN